jgi:hypothetical protein
MERFVKPRITVNLTASGEFEIWLNPEGRDLLVRELQRLDERSEHFHLAPDNMGEVELSTRAYRPTDTVISWGKVLLRTDEWDRQHFPHVFAEASDERDAK